MPHCQGGGSHSWFGSSNRAMGALLLLLGVLSLNCRLIQSFVPSAQNHRLSRSFIVTTSSSSSSTRSSSVLFFSDYLKSLSSSTHDVDSGGAKKGNYNLSSSKKHLSTRRDEDVGKSSNNNKSNNNGNGNGNKKDKYAYSTSATQVSDAQVILVEDDKDDVVVKVLSDDEVITETDVPELKLEEGQVYEDISELDAVDQAQFAADEKFMKMALEEALKGDPTPFPNPLVGAVLVSGDGRVLGAGHSDYNIHAIRDCLQNAGLSVTPLSSWVVSWPKSEQFRRDLSSATLYVTLEPSVERHGTAMASQTCLIQAAGIDRVVIGCADPVESRATRGAAALHAAGVSVFLGTALQEECESLISDYAVFINSKLHRMARNHFRLFGRPLGFLHCSVVASQNIQAFARHGNAFGTDFGGQKLGFRNFGSFEIAPPPEVIWADTSNGEEEDYSYDNMFKVDFEDEKYDSDPMPVGSPMMPWYEQVDAVVATFPRYGNGPPEDQSVTARLNGLKWLATHGQELPAGVERVLVMDATDLSDLPLTNSDPNLPKGVDVESFWKGAGRKPTRVLLRRGLNERARSAAVSAAAAAQAAAVAAQAAADAIESGDAERSAEAAVECQKLAMAEAAVLQAELTKTQKLKATLESLGVVVETIEGGEPVDVMKHLGSRNGLKTVVWRAGCWGDRGVRAILAGAFQWVSAHLAVDANGGRFWQLMLAENAIQSACGPSRKVKVFAEQEDICLEYCDEPEADPDCTMTLDGKPIRHVRVDCRLALVDDSRPREMRPSKVQKMNRKFIEEQAPWFL